MVRRIILAVEIVVFLCALCLSLEGPPAFTTWNQRAALTRAYIEEWMWYDQGRHNRGKDYPILEPFTYSDQQVEVFMFDVDTGYFSAALITEAEYGISLSMGWGERGALVSVNPWRLIEFPSDISDGGDWIFREKGPALSPRPIENYSYFRQIDRNISLLEKFLVDDLELAKVDYAVITYAEYHDGLKSKHSNIAEGRALLEYGGEKYIFDVGWDMRSDNRIGVSFFRYDLSLDPLVDLDDLRYAARIEEACWRRSVLRYGKRQIDWKTLGRTLASKLM